MKRVGTGDTKGFTLIEVMITIAIVGILTAVALPLYSDYVIRGRLTEAFTALGGAQPAAEQFWANGRTYVGFDSALSFPPASANFTYTLSNASASAYTVTATGQAKMAGFSYTIDQNGTRATTATPTGWGTSTSCWVDHKGGSCSTN
ncbi:MULTISPECIES: type IV pilin protein [Duganella]|jgi:type IV pilus assembly protein PilE|uniref:type IV pilin protein n=1 Tax=Duganella TaxID=75654 RepID=UPI00159D6DE8